MSLAPLSIAQRQAAFGPIQYRAMPTNSNPENIEILGDWVKENIIVVDLPWSNDGNTRKKVQFHRHAADALQFWFEEMKQLSLLNKLLTMDGTFCPRLVRGGITLSNHAFGTAIDLNATWNPLNHIPAQQGQKGSLLDIVPVAEKHGFFWGGNYQNRKDGMHFEYSLA